jgi:hypothetical protein
MRDMNEQEKIQELLDEGFATKGTCSICQDEGGDSPAPGPNDG